MKGMLIKVVNNRWILILYENFCALQILIIMRGTTNQRAIAMQGVVQEIQNSPFYGTQELPRPQLQQFNNQLFDDDNEVTTQLKKMVSFVQKVKSNMKAAHIKSASILSDIVKHLTLLINQIALNFFLKSNNQMSNNGTWQEIGSWLRYAVDIKTLCFVALSFIDGTQDINKVVSQLTQLINKSTSRMDQKYGNLIQAIKQQFRCLALLGSTVYKTLLAQQTDDQFRILKDVNTLLNRTDFEKFKERLNSIVRVQSLQLVQMINASTKNVLEKESFLNSMASLIPKRRKNLRQINTLLADAIQDVKSKTFRHKRRTYYKYYILGSVFLIAAKLHQIQCHIYEKCFHKSSKIEYVLKYGFYLTNQDYSKILRRAMEMNFYHFFCHNEINKLVINSNTFQLLTKQDKNQFNRKSQIFREVKDLLVSRSVSKNIEYLLDKPQPVKAIINSIVRKGLDVERTFQILAQNIKQHKKKSNEGQQMQGEKMDFNKQFLELSKKINQAENNGDQIVTNFRIVAQNQPSEHAVAASVRVAGAGIDAIAGVQSPYILDSLPQFDLDEKTLITQELYRQMQSSIQKCRQQFQKIFQAGSLEMNNKFLRNLKQTEQMKILIQTFKQEFQRDQLNTQTRIGELKDLVVKNLEISEKIQIIVQQNGGDIRVVNSQIQKLTQQHKRNNLTINQISRGMVSKKQMSEMLNEGNTMMMNKYNEGNNVIIDQYNKGNNMVIDQYNKGNNMMIDKYNEGNNNILKRFDERETEIDKKLQRDRQKTIQAMITKLAQLREKNNWEFDNDRVISGKVSDVKMQLNQFRKLYEAQINTNLHGKQLAIAVDKAMIIEKNVLQLADVLKRNDSSQISEIKKKIQILANNNIEQQQQQNRHSYQHSNRLQKFKKLFRKGRQLVLEQIGTSFKVLQKRSKLNVAVLKQKLEDNEANLNYQLEVFQQQLRQTNGQDKAQILTEIHGFLSQIQGLKNFFQGQTRDTRIINQTIYNNLRSKIGSMDQSLQGYINNIHLLQQRYRDHVQHLSKFITSDMSKLGQNLANGVQTLVNNGDQQALANYTQYQNIFQGMQTIQDTINQGFNETLRWQLYLGNLINSGHQQTFMNQAVTFQKIEQVQMQIHQSNQANWAIASKNAQLHSLLLLAISFLDRNLDINQFNQSTSEQLLDRFKILVQGKNQEIRVLTQNNSLWQVAMRQILLRCQIDSNSPDWKQHLLSKIDNMKQYERRKQAQVTNLHLELDQRKQQIDDVVDIGRHLQDQISQYKQNMQQLQKQIQILKKNLQITAIQKESADRQILSLQNCLDRLGQRESEQKNVLQRKSQDLDIKLTQERMQIIKLNQKIQQLMQDKQTLQRDLERKNQQQRFESIPRGANLAQSRGARFDLDDSRQGMQQRIDPQRYEEQLVKIVKQRKQKCLLSKEILQIELKNVQTLITELTTLKKDNKNRTQKIDANINLLKELKQKIQLTIKQLDSQLIAINKIATLNNNLLVKYQEKNKINKQQFDKLSAKSLQKDQQIRNLGEVKQTFLVKFEEFKQKQTAILLKISQLQAKKQQILEQLKKREAQHQVQEKKVSDFKIHLENLKKQIQQKAQHYDQILQVNDKLMKQKYSNRRANLQEKLKLQEEVSDLKQKYRKLNEAFLEAERKKVQLQSGIVEFKITLQTQRQIRQNKANYILGLQSQVMKGEQKAKAILDEKQKKIFELQDIILQKAKIQAQLLNNRKLLVTQQKYLDNVRKMHEKDILFIQNMVKMQDQFQKLVDRIEFLKKMKSEANLTQTQKLRIKQNERQIEDQKARMRVDRRYVMSFNAGLLMLNQDLKKVMAKQKAQKDQQKRSELQYDIDSIQAAIVSLTQRRQQFLRIIELQNDNMEVFRRFNRRSISIIERLDDSNQQFHSIVEQMLLDDDANQPPRNAQPPGNQPPRNAQPPGLPSQHDNKPPQNEKKQPPAGQKPSQSEKPSQPAKKTPPAETKKPTLQQHMSQKIPPEKLALSVAKFSFNILENVVSQNMEMIEICNFLIEQWTQIFQTYPAEGSVIAGIIEVFEGFSQMVEHCLLCILNPLFHQDLFQSNSNLAQMMTMFKLSFGQVIEKKRTQMSSKNKNKFDTAINRKLYLIE